MIDTHCHLDVTRFDGDRAQVLERAWAAGVTGLIIPAIGPLTWEPLLEWPARDARVQVALGMHPQFLPELDPALDDHHLHLLDEMLARGVALAVGECGLDGPTEARTPMERQVRVFRAHLALARKHDLPVLVHCLRAHQHLQRVLKEEAPVPRGLLMHSYSGSKELTRWYARMGCHFSFAGPVSFKEGRKPIEAANSVPLELLMAETDAPDQAPEPHRGTRCEPAYLPRVIEALAVGRAAEFEVVKEATTHNAARFFRSTFS